MKKLIIIMLFALLSNTAFAKETVNVFTKFSVASPPGRIIIDIIQRMNNYDPNHEYRFSSIPGAEGEAAIARAFAENGKVLLYANNAEFTIARDLYSKGYDKGKDFIFIHSFQSAPFAMMVPKKHNVSTLGELIQHLKNKDKSFYAHLASSTPTTILNSRFIRTFNLSNNLKQIVYTNITDVAQSTINGEYDFIIFEPTSMSPSMFDVIFTTSKGRHPFYPNIPSVDELGLNNLYFETLTFLSTPNRNTDFAKYVERIAEKVCSDPAFRDLLTKSMRIAKCIGSVELRKRLDEEYIQLR